LESADNPKGTEKHEAAASCSQISYMVPKAAVFQQFAQQVGEQMSEAFSDSRYADQAVVDGLANFLKIVCELTVKRLNSVSVTET
jgi:hypothetical protein